MSKVNHGPAPGSTGDNWLYFTLRWTPRTLVVGLTGYYCLGVAYEIGAMAAIDRIAIQILRPSMGYMGLAVFMPTFQWYSAWGVRVSVGLGTSFIYYLMEKIVTVIYNTLFCKPSESPPLLDRLQKNSQI